MCGHTEDVHDAMCTKILNTALAIAREFKVSPYLLLVSPNLRHGQPPALPINLVTTGIRIFLYVNALDFSPNQAEP